MLPDEFFKNTPIGVPIRLRHPGCTDQNKDRALVVTRFESGWKWFCHRCRQGGIKSLHSLSPSRIVKFTTPDTKTQLVNSEVRLPCDYTTHIPPEGLAWLYKYDITDEEIAYYDFGWSPSQSRVILPTYQFGTLVFWIGRLIGQPTRYNPKYSSVAANRRDIYFTANFPGSNNVAIVEDILSALRVGRFTTAIALISVHIPDDLICKLSKSYKRIIVWLDPDKHKKMLSVARRQQALGHNVTFRITDQDPKCYSDEVIEAIL